MAVKTEAHATIQKDCVVLWKYLNLAAESSLYFRLIGFFFYTSIDKSLPHPQNNKAGFTWFMCNIWFAETSSFWEWEAPHGHTSPSLAWYDWTHALEQKRPAPGAQYGCFSDLRDPHAGFLPEDVTSLLIDRANTCRDVRFDLIITQF